MSMSCVTFEESWNMGSKTMMSLEPSTFRSKPTIVIEWPTANQVKRLVGA
jgi:hypothetical protein